MRYLLDMVRQDLAARDAAQLEALKAAAEAAKAARMVVYPPYSAAYKALCASLRECPPPELAALLRHEQNGDPMADGLTVGDDGAVSLDLGRLTLPLTLSDEQRELVAKVVEYRPAAWDAGVRLSAAEDAVGQRERLNSARQYSNKELYTALKGWFLAKDPRLNLPAVVAPWSFGERASRVYDAAHTAWANKRDIAEKEWRNARDAAHEVYMRDPLKAADDAVLAVPAVARLVEALEGLSEGERLKVDFNREQVWVCIESRGDCEDIALHVIRLNEHPTVAQAVAAFWAAREAFQPPPRPVHDPEPTTIAVLWELVQNQDAALLAELEAGCR